MATETDDSDENKSVAGNTRGIVFTGKSQQESLWLGVCVGIDLETHELLFKTTTGAPEPSYFDKTDLGDPERTRRVILDVKQVLRESGRGFYVDKIETNFDEFWDEHGEELCGIIERTPEDSLEEEVNHFITTNFSPPQLESIDLRIVEARKLKFQSDDSDEDDDQTEPESDDPEPTNPSEHEQQTESSILKIEPVLDISHGIPVENLNPGKEISVRLVGRIADRIKSQIDEDSPDQLPPIPARVLSVDRESDSDNYTIITELQESVYGVAKIQEGSRIESDEHAPVPNEINYDNYLASLGWILASSMVVLAILVYFIIL